jgi:hypothetical protein
LLLAVSAPVDWLPEVPMTADHEAVQAVASVEDQVSIEDAPLATNVGFAAIDTVTVDPVGVGFPGPAVAVTLLVPLQAANARTNTRMGSKGTSSEGFMRNIGSSLILALTATVTSSRWFRNPEPERRGAQSTYYCYTNTTDVCARNANLEAIMININYVLLQH